MSPTWRDAPGAPGCWSPFLATATSARGTCPRSSASSAWPPTRCAWRVPAQPGAAAPGRKRDSRPPGAPTAGQPGAGVGWDERCISNTSRCRDPPPPSRALPQALSPDGSSFVTGNSKGQLHRYELDWGSGSGSAGPVADPSKRELRPQGSGHSEAVDCLVSLPARYIWSANESAVHSRAARPPPRRDFFLAGAWLASLARGECLSGTWPQWRLLPAGRCPRATPWEASSRGANLAARPTGSSSVW